MTLLLLPYNWVGLKHQRGPILCLPQAPWCKVLLLLLCRITEWKKSTHHTLVMRVQGVAHHRPPWKDQKNELLHRGWKSEWTAWPLEVCHKADGKGVHMSVGDILKAEGWEGTMDDHVPAFNTCWIAQFLLHINEVAIFLCVPWP